MPLYAIDDYEPTIHPSAFVHPDAVIIGDVRIGPQSSIWPRAVLRGDGGHIEVGAQTSIQDGTVIHTSESDPTVIGARCTIGHLVHIEGATIRDDTLVGSRSTVLNGAIVGPHAVVAAGALVPPGNTVPPHARALGVPCVIQEGKVNAHHNAAATSSYVERAQWYLTALRRLD